MVLDVLIKSSAILLAAWLFDRMSRGRATAAVRHAVWGCALAAALLVPALAAVLPAWHVPMPGALAGLVERMPLTPANAGPGATRGQSLRASNAVATDDQHLPAPTPGAAPGRAVAAAPDHIEIAMPNAGLRPDAMPGQDLSATARVEPGPALVTILGTIWLAGTGLLLARLLVGLVCAARLGRTATRAKAPWLGMGVRLAHRMGVTRRVRFVRADSVVMPMACGLVRPAVVLPPTADAWPDARLEAVLLHELAHVRRRDCLTQALADATLALHWVNPLAWIAVRALRRERERACDDLVLVSGTAPDEYAEHLIAVARAARQRPLVPALAGGVAMAHRSELEGRLMAILDAARPRRALTRLHLTTTAAFSLAVAIPLAAMTPWGERVEILDPTPNAAIAALPTAPVTLDAPVSTPRAPLASVVAPRTVVTTATTTTSVNSMRVSPAVAVALTSVVAETLTALQGTPTPTPRPTPTPTPTPTPAAPPVEGGVSGGIRGGVPGAGPVLAPGRATPRKPADPRVVAALAEALKDTDAEVRAQALHTLGQLRDPATVDALIGALADKEPEVRQQAAFALGQLRDKRAQAAVAKLVSDTDADVREQAIFALGQLRDPASVDVLANALKDPNEDVRQQAAFALGQIRDARAVDALLAAAKDKDTDVRQQVLFALAQIGDPRAQDAALAALKDTDPEVRRMAAHVLAQVVGR